MSKALAPIDEVRKSLVAMGPQFKMALPKHISPARFMRIVLTAAQTAPELLTADRTSFYAACMKSAQEGLLPDGKESALVVYNTKQGPKVSYQPMVYGILKKCRNSGEILSITAQVVYEKDHFQYWLDESGEHIEHRPQMFGDRGRVLGVYAMAKTKDGGVYVEVMTSDEVEAVRNVSRAADSGPWAGPFASEMWRKTALKRLSKRLPMSTDLEMTFAQDEELFDFSSEAKARLVNEASSEPAQAAESRKPKRLAALVKKTKESSEQTEDDKEGGNEPLFPEEEERHGKDNTVI